MLLLSQETVIVQELCILKDVNLLREVLSLNIKAKVKDMNA